eukprot:UN13452
MSFRFNTVYFAKYIRTVSLIMILKNVPDGHAQQSSPIFLSRFRRNKCPWYTSHQRILNTTPNASEKMKSSLTYRFYPTFE